MDDGEGLNATDGSLHLLSHEIVLNISKYLDAKCILGLGSTASTLYFLRNHLQLWEFLCFRDFGISPDVISSTLDWYYLYQKLCSPIVLTWGVIQGGRLRHEGDTWRNIVIPTRIESNDIGKISSISCSGFGTHVLTLHGSVWFWGRLNDLSPVTRGDRIPLIEPCYRLASGRTFGVSLSERGNCYVWVDTNQCGAYHVVQCNLHSHKNAIVRSHVSQMAAGWNHVAMLSKDGYLKTFPIHSLEDVDSIPWLQVFPSSTNDPFVSLVAGYMFTAGLTKSGKVYWWHEIGAVPVLLQSTSNIGLDHLQYTHLSAGPHEISLVSTGCVYVININRLDVVSYPISIGIGDISHGDSHIGIVLMNGDVMTWGNGSSALGLGIDDDNCNFNQPVEIKRGLNNLYVFKIGFGGWHSSALAIKISDFKIL